MLYFTSDTHFSHKNIIRYTNRPFAHVDAMNQALIDGISLTEDDHLYHLGDVTFSNPNRLYFLKKHKENTLILGNHDKEINKLQNIFDSIHNQHYIDYQGLKIELIHHPDQQQGDGDLTLCGHVHNNWHYKKPKETHVFIQDKAIGKEIYTFKVPTINLSVECWDYKAVSIDEILQFAIDKHLL